MRSNIISFVIDSVFDLVSVIRVDVEAMLRGLFPNCAALCAHYGTAAKPAAGKPGGHATAAGLPRARYQGGVTRRSWRTWATRSLDGITG